MGILPALSLLGLAAPLFRRLTHALEMHVPYKESMEGSVRNASEKQLRPAAAILWVEGTRGWFWAAPSPGEKGWTTGADQGLVGW